MLRVVICLLGWVVNLFVLFVACCFGVCCCILLCLVFGSVSCGGWYWLLCLWGMLVCAWLMVCGLGLWCGLVCCVMGFDIVGYATSTFVVVLIVCFVL